MDDAPPLFPEDSSIGGQNRDYVADLEEDIPSSSLPSGIEDDSGYTDETGEVRGGLIDDLLGPSYRRRYKDSSIHIHIGTVHYHGDGSTRGLYAAPNVQGYAQHPPQPCHPPTKNINYASSPAPNLRPPSSSGQLRRIHRPRSDEFETIAAQQQTTDTEDVQINIPPEGAESSSSCNVPLSTFAAHDTSLESNLSRLRVTQSEKVINGVPSHLEVSMEMDGDDSVMWTGELKCVPSVPDLRPRPSAAAPPHRPKSVLYINSAHIGQQKKTVFHGVQEVDYVNYSQPFSNVQPYRIASARIPDAPQINRHSIHGTPDNLEAPIEHRMSASSQPSKDLNASSKIGGKTWKSTTNLTEHAPIARGKEGSNRCSAFYCITEGFYSDIEDENEKAHIKECLMIKGKSGQWLILTLQNHPLNRFCLEVKAQDEVLSFPVMLTHKKKYKIDPSRKGFKCICKLIEFYKKNKLPSCNVNLGAPFPRSLIPPAEAEADCSDEVKMQYAGIRL